MSVSPADRRQAATMDRDRAALERLGARAAVRIGLNARGAARAALGRGADPAFFARQVLVSSFPLLVDAMVAGHLKGRQRQAITAAAHFRGRGTVKLSGTAYDGAIEFLERWLEITPEDVGELRNVYGEQAARVLNVLQGGVSQHVTAAMRAITAKGMHVREGVATLRKAFDAAGVTPDSSYALENLFRTQTQLAYSAGRWNGLQAEEVQEILWGFKYVTVGDDRVRPAHEAMDGVTLPKGDPFWSNNFPPNGFSCRCFLPGTRVGGQFVVGSKARYAGPAVEIKTARGCRLAVTANHPVLTGKGWVAAASLHEGDALFSHAPDVQRARFGRVNDQQTPAPIEDVFEALARHGTLVAHPRALDFDSDAQRFVGDIHLVISDPRLRPHLHAALADRIKQFVLPLADRAGGLGPRGPHLSKHGLPVLPQGFPADGARLRRPPRHNASREQKAADHASLRAQPMSDGVFGFAPFVGGEDGGNVQAPHFLSETCGGAQAALAQEGDHGPDIHLEAPGDFGGRSPLATHSQHGGLVVAEFGRRVLGPDWQSMPAKVGVQGRHRHADFIGNLLERCAGLVATDKIVSIKRFDYSGHVFDLQSTKGWLFAEGIVASNCAALEIFRVEEEPVPASVAARARRIGGVWVQPQADDGFGFNPGELFRDAVAA